MKWFKRKQEESETRTDPSAAASEDRASHAARAAEARARREQIQQEKAQRDAMAQAEAARAEQEARALPAELDDATRSRLENVVTDASPGEAADSARTELSSPRDDDDAFMVHLLRELCTAYDRSEAAHGAQMRAAWTAPEPGVPKQPPADVEAAYVRAREDVERYEAIATVIGQTLNTRGGKAEMVRVFELVGSVSGRRTLEMHWNGIGDWLG